MKSLRNFMLPRRRVAQLPKTSPVVVRKPGDLRIVAVTRALDEADIIEAFVRHTATYVSHHIVIDNGSSDGTVDILIRMREEGIPLTIFSNKSISYIEQASNRFLFDEAMSCDADWVLFFDGDEFLEDRGVQGGLRAMFDRLSLGRSHEEGILLHVYNYILSKEDKCSEIVVPQRLNHRLAQSHSSHVALPTTLAYRNLTIANGAHFAICEDGSPVACYPQDGLVIAHYSIRSPYQSLAKAIKGWSKVLVAGPKEISRGTSYHYKGIFEALRDRPHELLRNESYMAGQEEVTQLIFDPIDYKGGELRYTSEVDHSMRAVKGLMGYLEQLAGQVGVLLETFPEARSLVADRDKIHERL